MKIQELKEKLTVLTKNFNKENFIFDFLISFGISKNTITRLKKGDSNLSKKEGELFYKNKIFFKEEFSGNLLDVIDEAAKDDKILKHNPRFILVSDYETIVAVDVRLKANKHFSFSELPEQANFFLPLSGAEIYKVSTNNKADRDAAYQLGRLYEILVNDNPDWLTNGSHHLNLFLSRLLFCFFAEDTGIFEIESIFTETLVNNTNEDGSDVDHFLNTLFKKLNSKTGDFPEYLNSFPYVNGGLFKDEIISPKFSKKARNILIDSGELNWSEINPDIFGSMIQAVADPEQRSNLGMHYTSVENILKLIKPLFLDELEEEFEKNMDNPKGLRKLIDRISKIKFFDPACGSGNLRQYVVVDSVIKNSTVEEQGSKKFIKMAGSFVNIDDINIELIDRINPFQKAFEILSKSVTTSVLRAIQDTINITKIEMTEQEAVILWPKINAWVKETGEKPNIQSTNPIEQRLAQALLFIQDAKRKKMQNG